MCCSGSDSWQQVRSESSFFFFFAEGEGHREFGFSYERFHLLWFNFTLLSTTFEGPLKWQMGSMPFILFVSGSYQFGSGCSTRVTLWSTHLHGAVMLQQFDQLLSFMCGCRRGRKSNRYRISMISDSLRGTGFSLTSSASLQTQ